MIGVGLEIGLATVGGVAVAVALAVETNQRAGAVVQFPPAQSDPVTHRWPGAQVGQAPPQSKSVSDPFLTLSEHVGWEHVPLAQTSLSQSVAWVHFGRPARRAPTAAAIDVGFFPDCTWSVHETL